MAQRDACERRVYRLATLLTGNPNAATAVITSVVDAQPDLSRLDNAHMDRLTVLRSREIKPATLVADDVDLQVAAALASLSPQQREAWVFAHVYRMPAREAAKAMDCSVHAAELHLRTAAEAMATRAGAAQADAAAALLAYSMSLDVPEFFRRQRRQRSARRRVAILACVVLLLILMALGLAWWRDRAAANTGHRPARSPSISAWRSPPRAGPAMDGILSAPISAHDAV